MPPSSPHVCVGVCVHYQQFAVLIQQSVVLHRQVLSLFLHGLNVTVRLLQGCWTQICSCFCSTQQTSMITRISPDTHSHTHYIQELCSIKLGILSKMKWYETGNDDQPTYTSCFCCLCWAFEWTRRQWMNEGKFPINSGSALSCCKLVVSSHPQRPVLGFLLHPYRF